MRRLSVLVSLSWACAGEEPQELPTPATSPPTIPGDVVPEEGAPIVSAYLSGRFETLPAFAGVASVDGTALLSRNLDGTASLSLSVAGLAPSVEHTAHVHAQPCDYGEGGGHYYLDPASPDIGEANEIWPLLSPGPDGYSNVSISIPEAPRGDALSIVVHDPETNSKLACADLVPEQILGATASGTFSAFAAYEAIDEAIGGTAALLMSSSSELTLDLSGLSEADSYLAHLHVMPCEVIDGGGHYKLDPSVVEALAANEVWPEIVVAPGGTAQATAEVSGHTIREDGASVVLHRVAGEEVPKVACANLAREAYLPLTTFGALGALPASASTLRGSATLLRRFDGATLLSLDVAGATPNTAYTAHLHALPCGVLDGGGHYKIDPAGPDGDEANELWVALRADGAGVMKRTVGITHQARAEAQSVVVHDEAGTKLVCADLD